MQTKTPGDGAGMINCDPLGSCFNSDLAEIGLAIQLPSDHATLLLGMIFLPTDAQAKQAQLAKATVETSGESEEEFNCTGLASSASTACIY